MCNISLFYFISYSVIHHIKLKDYKFRDYDFKRDSTENGGESYPNLNMKGFFHRVVNGFIGASAVY
jgi:hypothetical protein